MPLLRTGKAGPVTGAEKCRVDADALQANGDRAGVRASLDGRLRFGERTLRVGARSLNDVAGNACRGRLGRCLLAGMVGSGPEPKLARYIQIKEAIKTG